MNPFALDVIAACCATFFVVGTAPAEVVERCSCVTVNPPIGAHRRHEPAPDVADEPLAAPIESEPPLGPVGRIPFASP